MFIITQQTGQGPKVKSPPPVPPKPKRHQSQPAIKPQTAPAAPQPKRLDLLPEQHQDPSSPEQPQDPSASNQPQDPSSLKQPHDPSAADQPQDPSSPKQLQNPSALEQPQDPSSLEYITLKEMLADLVDLLAGNAPVITQLNNHLFSPSLIPEAVHIAVETIGLSPFEKANKMMNAVLATLKSHPNPNNAFTSLITALHKVGLVTFATKLASAFGKYCICISVNSILHFLEKSGGHIAENKQLQPEVEPHPTPQPEVEPHLTPQPEAEPHPSLQQKDAAPLPPTVIELSSKEEVACNIESLHTQFSGLVTKIRLRFDELVSSGQLKPFAVAMQAEEALGQDIQLSEINMHSIFSAIRPRYDFMNVRLLQNLVHHFIPSTDQLHTELTQYIVNVDKFSESSQLKHIKSTIKEKLSHLPASPSTSDQTKPVVIKLHDRWEEMTLKNFKKVLQHHFEPKFADLFSLVDIEPGSVIITLQIPTTQAQYLIDTINIKTHSMKRLGIMEVAVDNNTIPIRREDDNNFDVSLHQSVKAGDSFEVSVLLQLGANPNNKDEEGKYPVETAREGGHDKVILTLLTGGAIDSKLFNHIHGHGLCN